MDLTIITPCSRPKNLHRMHKSIPQGVRWIIVFDMDRCDIKIPNAEHYFYKEHAYGYPQTNFALDMIKDGYVYFLDDDNTVHPDLIDNIRGVDNDFIHFLQQRCERKKTHPKYIIGSEVRGGKIDKGGVLLKRTLIGDIRFRTDIYAADGYFIEDCYKKATSPLFIDKVLSYHNKLNV